MDNALIIENLKQIKASIIKNAGDVLWMENSVNETVCERIDSVLLTLGCSEDELESAYQVESDDE